MKSFARLSRLLVALSFLSLLLSGCGASGNGASTPTAPTAAIPTIVSISPNILSASPIGTVQITITGTGFLTSSQVQGNGSSLATTYVSSTELQANVPTSLVVAGTKLVIVISNGSLSSDSSVAAATVTIAAPQPVITSLSPATSLVGSGPQTVTVTGTSFVPSTSITVNSVARTTTYLNTTQVGVDLTAEDVAAAGGLSFVAVNALLDGGSSAAVTFSVNNPMPVIKSISPSAVLEGSATQTLDVKGSGYVDGSTVYWNKTPLTTTLVSGNELNAPLSTTLLATATSASVAVVNPAPGGGQSEAVTFSVNSPVPQLNTIQPATVEINQAATISINGSGFASNSTVQWNGSPRPSSFISATSLTVSLTATDLAAAGTGKVTVSNPAPGGGTTQALTLTITNQPIPTITGVSLSIQSFNQCQQIQVHATGTNLFGAALVVNGQTLQNAALGNETDVFGYLPAGFSSSPGQFSVIATETYGALLSSEPYLLQATAAPMLTLCTTPVGPTIYPASKFLVGFVATQVNTAGNATVNTLTLPAGFTTTASLPITIPVGAQGSPRVAFSAASTLAAGSVNIPFTAISGATTAGGMIAVTVSSYPSSTFFTSSPFSELAVPIGGSNSISFSSGGQGQDYAIDLAVSGLPAGTTATINPSTIIPGDSFTVTVSAASSAPEDQNVPITITGIPSVAGVTAPTASFSLDVAPAPGSLPNNRSDFVSTEATPYGLAYDRPLDLIFVSNPTWNRVDVLSNQTHTLLRSIPIRGPQGIDVSQDGSTVWIGTNSQQVFALNTTTFALTRYLLPQVSGNSWVDYTLLALSDGTLLLNSMVWTPSTNQISSLAGPDFTLRSGDGSKAYGSTYASGYTNAVYDVQTKTLNTLPTLGQGSAITAANGDGSVLVGSDNKVYTGSAQLLGTLPEYLGNYYVESHLSTVFSPDGATLYQIGAGADARIATIDVASLTLKGVAPALATLPTGVSENPVNTLSSAIDNAGVLIGIQTYGVGFDDSTYFQNFGSSTRSAEYPVLLSPDAGQLAGGTASQPYGFYGLTPDIWYGANRGAASLDGNGTLTITSPAGAADGPVNLKYLYPDGEEVFTPQAFSYSSYPQHSVLSGANPLGGVPGRISGYGMPADASGGTLTLGGQAATITTTVGQYPPYTGEAFPSTYLDYTIPPGNPGFADLTVTTPIGSGTLPKAVFYAQSVIDYSNADSFTDVLYDPFRQQVYLSGTDHIDVFSLTSQSWLSPLKPATLGSSSQFRGLSLSPDGSQLLAANLLDNSLGVINPDTPSQTFAIGIPAALSYGAGCGTGPFSVAALAGGQAFVSSGLPTGIGGCPYNQTLYLANLTTHSVAPVTAASNYSCYGDASTNEASSDGTIAIVGGEEGGACLYSTASNSFLIGHQGSFDDYGAAIAGDGNIASISNSFVDTSGNMIGGLARPSVLFSNQTTTPYPLNNYPSNTLNRPRLNSSGSLYYWAYPNYFEIFDVPTATLKMRFSLAETIQNVETPLAIDQGGRQIFLITDKGLTVVDLGTAPLSIGHLSSSSGIAATQIQVRGSGFATGLGVTVGGQAAAAVFNDENTLSFTVPTTLSSGPHDLTITNPNGTSYTLTSAIITP